MTTRRSFLRTSGYIGLGLAGLKLYACGSSNMPSAVPSAKVPAVDYGSLIADPKGLLELPTGFTYTVISKHGDKMDDGFLLPGKPDAMGTFDLGNGKMAVIQNHEMIPTDLHLGAFGPENEELDKIDASMLYEYGSGKYPGLGGTTTFLFNEDTQTIEKQWLSLAGTVRNCAGGVMPWGSWLSCEEDVTKAGSYDGLCEKDHGFVFEVPVTDDIKLHPPVALKAMGRMNHEATACDPKTGIIYLTEDRPDGCFYRFIPNKKGQLSEGGKLQALAIKDKPKFYTRNWVDQPNEPIEMNQPYQTEWVNLENVESPDDTLRFQAQEKGAAVFARGEGLWFGDGELYFACTNGAPNLKGQIFRYRPSENEGQGKDGKLELWIEPNDDAVMKYCDNLTVAPWGDVMVCEDDTQAYLRGVRPDGSVYTFGKTTAPVGEFTGICFSPSGKTMFVNIQHEGLTLAITGPWEG